MKNIELEKIVYIKLGLTHTPTYVNKGVPFLSVKDISNGAINFDNCKYITKEEYDSLPQGAKPQIGDMLFCRVGTIGKPILVDERTPKFGSFVSLGYFRNKDERMLHLNYLKHWMNSENFMKQVQSNVKGASQINLNTGWLSKFTVPIGNLEDQKYKTQILDKTISIIHNKKQQLHEYDQLIKSRFVEMFGQDLKGKSIRLGDLAEVITKGTTPTTLGYDFVDDGVNFIKVECITETGKFIKEKMLHINEECNEKLKRSKLKKDDILFSIAGAIGRTAIVTDDILPANTNQALSIIRLRKDVGLNVEFLNQVFKTDLVAEQIEKRINGVAQMNVSLTDIGNLKIIRPTIERQNEFAKFVQQVDKLKFVVQKSLDETQKLFDSLMQEYFG